MRLLTLLTDAYGGRGGIAKFNRDLLAALCSHPASSEVVALPRVESTEKFDPADLPPRLSYRTKSAGGKIHYALAVGKALGTGGTFDGVVCGHLNLLSLAALAARWKRVPLLLVLHGIEAWQRPEGWGMAALTRRAIPSVDAFAAVSGVTRERFLLWSDVPETAAHVIPNCVDPSGYGQGNKRSKLLDRYGLHDHTVLFTLGRLSSSERYKGFDEVMEALPSVAAVVPDVVYLIAGDGDDRCRLEAKARALQISDRVIFAGYVPEEEKADHYRLADAFVMPGRGEGFGIVYLEALACGVPVVASSLDGSREAVRDGLLGEVVDPDDPESVKRGILSALTTSSDGIPDGLAYFSFEQFQARWHRVVDRVFLRERSRANP